MNIARGILIGLAIVPFLVGCGGAGGGSGSATVRAMNAIPGLTAGTLTVGANIVLEGAAYAGFSTYNSVGSSSAQQLLLTSGTGVTLAQTTANINSGAIYTIYAVNTLASPQLFVSQEDHSAPATGNARINVVNLSHALAGTDVYVTTPTTDISTIAATLSNVAFAGTANIEKAAATYRIRFTRPGTKTVVADKTTSLSSGTLPRFFLLGPLGYLTG